MDTARLRVLRTYPEVKALLVSLLADQELIPTGDHRILQSDQLPQPLQKAFLRAERRGCAWAAWRKDREHFAITAVLDEARSRMHSRPVLEVFLYDVKGHVIGCTAWLETQPHRWVTCE